MPTSSATLPGLIVQMLRHAHVYDGADVLDVGTGSGYGCAVLAQRLGGQHVTSVDVDAYLTKVAVEPIPGAALTDLDEYAFTSVLLPALLPPDVLEENERSTEQRLAALRLTSQDGIPTAAGVLAVGVDPLAFVPGAYVQFLRIDGDGLDAPIKDEKRLDGTLLDVLRQLDEVLELNITTSVDFTSSRREERMADYPLVALQRPHRGDQPRWALRDRLG